MNTITMPKMGITMTEGTVVQWFKAVGDTVTMGDDLYEYESDKSSIVVQSPYSGILKEILVEEGEVAEVDAPLAVIE